MTKALGVSQGLDTEGFLLWKGPNKTGKNLAWGKWNQRAGQMIRHGFTLRPQNYPQAGIRMDQRSGPRGRRQA